MTITLRTIAAAGAGITAVALTASLAAPAGAAPAAVKTGVTTNHVQAAAGWLGGQFVSGATHLPSPDGNHFESEFGGTHYANYGENDDVIFGLAAAKAGSAKAGEATSYLQKNVDGYADPAGKDGGPYDGSLAKLAVGAQVAGVSATSFGGDNLLALLKKDECPADSTTCTPGQAANIFSGISESFVMIAETRAGGKYAPSPAAKTYFGSLQCTSGGFTGATAACGDGDSDIDATSYAIMALTALKAAGDTAADTQLTGAVQWLQGQQTNEGYWETQDVANPNSTGLAVSALQGAGALYGRGREWLLSQQQGPGKGAGALKYDGKVSATTTSATSLSVLATAQGLTGLVDGSTLATLTAKGSKAGTAVFQPTADTVYTQHRGAKYEISGGGFAPAEKVRVSLGSSTRTVVVGPLGGYHATLEVTAPAGYASYTVTGLTSGLTATHHVHVTA